MKTWTFADVAAHWDATPDYDAINAGIDSYLRRFKDSEPLFSIPENASVLDIDCRTCVGTAYFLKRHPRARFTCLAMAGSFVTRGRERLAREGVAADVRQVTGLPLDLPDAAFDVALSYETLEHVPDPRTFVSELARVLKPGGTLVLTTPNRLWEPVHWLSATLHLDHGEGPHRMLPRREILSHLREAGLTVTTERTFVLVPVGPRWLLALGRWKEKILPERALRLLALRRTFICFKHG